MDTINDIQYFVKESQFEQALVDLLPHHGWEKEVIVQPTEEDLIQNWAKILFDNNRDINKLGNYPLTASEMRQIIDQVNLCDSPYAMNMFINGGQVCIKRDNPADTNNYGKEVYLKIFDAREISAGQSRYQIARQPRFKASHPLGGDRRGDVMLLINGMPVIHIELKRSKVDVSQATFQIKRYTHEGVFGNGIFKMVQIFVAMTPEETLYFANPGKEENFKPEFYFHWEDFNNTVIRDWRRIVSDLLSIPMAHQLIGYYTIADDKDKTLKVLRSYQYFAASKISDITHKTNWDTSSASWRICVAYHRFRKDHDQFQVCTAHCQFRRCRQSRILIRPHRTERAIVGRISWICGRRRSYSGYAEHSYPVE